MKTKTLIKKQTQRKKNPELVKTIIAAKKNDKWLKIAGMLSGPRRKRTDLNLKEIDKKAKKEEIIIVPGKILSQGEINKKIKIVALNFSDKAKEKLKESKINFTTIINEIKENPEAKGIRILNAGFKNPTLSKTKEVFNK